MSDFERFRRLVQGIDGLVDAKRDRQREERDQERLQAKVAREQEVQKRRDVEQLSRNIIQESDIINLLNKIRREYLGGAGSVRLEDFVYTPYSVTSTVGIPGDPGSTYVTRESYERRVVLGRGRKGKVSLSFEFSLYPSTNRGIESQGQLSGLYYGSYRGEGIGGFLKSKEYEGHSGSRRFYIDNPSFIIEQATYRRPSTESELDIVELSDLREYTELHLSKIAYSCIAQSKGLDSWDLNE